ncbi:hypothetical protein BpHYR1_029721 [Brachionus plicatilis]|uniref:RNA-directed DNA polymerase from mobile element jockey-like n=1 Tax=Brachionus plicatilis TaxID=10195 RepID=A0A3M7RF85_BRAPC|nr:hypothetical protein BpHYR1_029721 [Brachionus plicatilis]
MKISVEKSCSVVFSRYKKESDNLNLKIYGNRILNQKEIKFLLRVNCTCEPNLLKNTPIDTYLGKYLKMYLAFLTKSRVQYYYYLSSQFLKSIGPVYWFG